MSRSLIKLAATSLSMRTICMVCLIWLVAGCASWEQQGSGSEIDQAEETWQQQGIQSYTIEIMHFQSIWRAESYKITVVNGVVVSNSDECIPGPAQIGECEVAEYDPQDFTVEGLFAIARSENQKQEGKFTKIEFDPTNGFPTIISYDDPDVFDEDRSWSVVSFEVGE